MSMHDSMILDMDAFDFSMIDSDIVVVGGDEKQAPQRGKSEEVYEEDYEDDVYDDEDDFSFEDEEEEEVPEEETVTIDGDLDSLDDDFEFRMGDSTLTKAELVQHVQKAQEVSKKAEELDSYFKNFKQIDDQMNHAFVASATENDIKLTHIRNKMKDPNISDAERGRLFTEISKLEQNKRVLDDRVQQFFQARELREQQEEVVRISRTNAVMSEKYGSDWAANMAPSLTQYIVDSGIASPEMRKAVSPAMLEVLLKAMKYDNLEKKSKDKVTSSVKKKSARSTSGAAQGRPNKVNKAVHNFSRAMKQGDAVEAFKYLVD